MIVTTWSCAFLSFMLEQRRHGCKLLWPKFRTSGLFIIKFLQLVFRSRLHYTDDTGTSVETLQISEANAALASSDGDDRFEALRLREHTLRKRLRAVVNAKSNELDKRRHNTDRKAKKALLVAVIGYTNAGKTTLIKR